MDGLVDEWMDGCVKNEVTIHVYNSNGVHGPQCPAQCCALIKALSLVTIARGKQYS